MNKQFIVEILRDCQTWKEGQKVCFIYKGWELIFRKEEALYSPFQFSMSGKRTGTCETWTRRYYSADDAFLHILNNFNENANIKDKYKTVEEAILIEF